MRVTSKMAPCTWTLAVFSVFISQYEVWASDAFHYYETMATSDIGSRVKRSADPNPALHMREVWFTTLGRSFHLYLKQSHVLSDEFKARILHQNGTSSYFNVDRNKFLTGKLKGDDTAEVKVHWEGNHVMTAAIFTDEETYVIEPSWRHLAPSENHSMISYRQSDLKWQVGTEAFEGKFCGVQNKNMNLSVEDINAMADEEDEDVEKLYPVPDEPQNTYGGHKRYKRLASCVGTHLNCKLTVVADYRFFDYIGRGDRYQTSEYIGSMIDRVNHYYQRTRFPDDGDRNDAVGLGFELSEMIILDSYSTFRGDHYNKKDRPGDMDSVLDLFGNSHYQDFTKVCLGHLFTYQAFDGKLGLAYIASSNTGEIGGICSRTGYVNSKRQAVNTGVSSFQTPSGSTAPVIQASITVSHELGHNWGAEHDPDTSECSPSWWSGGKYIMYPSATTGDDRNNKYFSPCSRQYIYNVLRRKGYRCLSEKSAAQGFYLCGNGRIDGEEECDAGFDGDVCCGKDCKLKPGATCSFTNFPCCNNSCLTATTNKTCRASLDDFDCKQASTCDGIGLKCPKPENEPDGTKCQEDTGKCFNGVCQGVCEQEGKTPCACEGESTACVPCCGNATYCRPIPGGKTLPDGYRCYMGFCEKGKCKRSKDFIARLFDIIQIIDINFIAEFMKNNIVWCILLLCGILWAIFVAIFDYVDTKMEKKDKVQREKITKQRNDLFLSEEDEMKTRHISSGIKDRTSL